MKKMKVVEKLTLIPSSFKLKLSRTGYKDTDMLNRVLEALYNNHKVKLTHDVCGDAIVSMNPQKNRIEIQTTSISFTEDNIYSWMLNTSTKWYIYDEVSELIDINKELDKILDLLCVPSNNKLDAIKSIKSLL